MFTPRISDALRLVSGVSLFVLLATQQKVCAHLAARDAQTCTRASTAAPRSSDTPQPRRKPRLTLTMALPDAALPRSAHVEIRAVETGTDEANAAGRRTGRRLADISVSAPAAGDLWRPPAWTRRLIACVDRPRQSVVWPDARVVGFLTSYASLAPPRA
jgi:hypothetical protein